MVEEKEVSEPDVVEFTPHENIEAAYNVLNTLDVIDGGMMTKKEKAKLDRAKKQAIDILCSELDTIHKTLFSKEEEETE